MLPKYYIMLADKTFFPLLLTDDKNIINHIPEKNNFLSNSISLYEE